MSNQDNRNPHFQTFGNAFNSARIPRHILHRKSTQANWSGPVEFDVAAECVSLRINAPGGGFQPAYIDILSDFRKICFRNPMARDLGDACLPGSHRS